ncbi:MAG: T9SS type A sorting domain-containing protein [Bacteroidetes bacterium]|nr:T9SS type A sorting domain-containing protein [Bacteroidota bacterium]
MKKIYTIVVAFVFMSTIAFAQSTHYGIEQYGKTLPGKTSVYKPSHQVSRAANERWYNYGFTMYDVLAKPDIYWQLNYLFPDSTILADFGGTFAPPWIHNIGDVLDVSSDMFNEASLYPGQLKLTSASTFSVDSIEIWFLYMRNLPDSIVDTLVVSVAAHASFSGLSGFIGSAINTNLGADSVLFFDLGYSSATNSLSQSGKITFKLPLTVADTATNEYGVNRVVFAPTGLGTLAGSKNIAVTYSFVPGYSWVPNVDTVTSMNEFDFLSFDEDDAGLPFYSKWDFNVSYIIPYDVRYDAAGSWNGSYVPSFAYMGTSSHYSYVHHAIFYKLTGISNYEIMSIEETEVNSNVVLGNAYPNPATSTSEVIIPVNVRADAGVATLNIFNSIGQRVSSEVLNLNSGMNRIPVNTSNLNNGIYFYSLENNGGNATRSFVIQ